ncbi:MAG: peptidyl-prolyl cis-trans isomerase [Planctomycetes bacterium]|nr:peptidyl-prolyl cis-trans isomerase [Planctomycetota bacterium]
MRATAFVILAFLMVGCGGEELLPPSAETDSWVKEINARKEVDAKTIEVQHCLIGVKQYGTKATLDAAQARALADDVLKRARAGEDFAALVKEHTTDGGPSKYTLSKAKDSGLVPAFTKVSWRLKVGEVGITLYHSSGSPYGFHIIKRLK